MDLGAAVVTLAVALIAVLPRVPALTRNGRAQAAIQRNAELWASLPEGDARTRLARHVEEQTVALLKERERKTPLESGWLYGTAWLGAAWVLLVVSTAISGHEMWAEQVRIALQYAGLGSGMIGLVVLILTFLLGAWRGAIRLRDHLRTRGGPDQPPADAPDPADGPPV